MLRAQSPNALRIPSTAAAVARVGWRSEPTTAALIKSDPFAHRCEQVENLVSLGPDLVPRLLEHLSHGMQVKYADVRLGAVLNMVHEGIDAHLEQIVARFVRGGELVVDDSVVIASPVVEDVVEDAANV